MRATPIDQYLSESILADLRRAISLASVPGKIVRMVRCPHTILSPIFDQICQRGRPFTPTVLGKAVDFSTHDGFDVVTVVDTRNQSDAVRILDPSGKEIGN
jgi:hypothetical protein